MSEPLDLDGVPAGLWQRVAGARHRLLMLDYDGTLAAYTAVRSEARPLPRTLALLERLAMGHHTRLAFVSGRPLAELESLLSIAPATYVGEHGWEQREAHGARVRHPLAPEIDRLLGDAERAARRRGWGEWLERKRTGLVLHTRGLPPERAAALEALCLADWRPLEAAGRATVDRTDGGVELRASDRDKGTAVRTLHAACPRDTLAVFVGDDVTDEDAFAAVADMGFGVRVGPGDRPSLAVARLPGSEAVPAFLEEWLRLVEASPAG